MKGAGRAAVALAACVAGFGLLQGSNLEASAVVPALALMAAAGAVADRLWAAMVPLLAYVPFVVYLSANAREGASGLSSWEFGALAYGVLTLAAIAAMLLGFGLRRAGRYDRRQRLSAGGRS